MDVLDTLRTRLADRYVLDHEIGRGGMATVYLARDIRHNRKVALKVLNPELGAVLGVERFLAEIQVTANLQHPNLLPLFDSGEAEGLLFYVMPFIEGESLRALLQREKQLPIDDAVRMASSVLAALDYAHRHGVIHRDLKPENILVHEGQPLVADFGIALAVSNAGGNRITQTGLSLGTPHYMSPEQATGDREIDGRTDVYSAGALLYEMLVGEPPHDGKTSQAVIAKVLTDKPRRIRLSRDTVPPHVEEAVDRALAKLPADRFPTAQAFADALSGRSLPRMVTSYAEPTAPPASAPQSRRRVLLPWGIAAAAAIMAGVALVSGGAAESDAAVTRYELAPPEQGRWVPSTAKIVAAAPGGRFVAYVAVGEDSMPRVYLRETGDIVPREVAGSEGAAAPFFSPDGEWLGFWAGGQIRKVPVAGGRPVPVGDFEVSAATWSPSGWIIVASPQGLWRAPANGGEFERFAGSDSVAPFYPVALADGESVLFSIYGQGGTPTARIAVASLKTGDVTVLDVLGAAPLGMVDGNLVYVTAAGVVMALPFDVPARRVRGTSLSLVDQVSVDAAVGAAHASLTPNGELIYMSGVARRQLVLVGGDGAMRRIGEPGAYSWPRLSPDGRRVALSVGTLARRNIWVYELPNGPFTQVTQTGSINDRPEWSADGSTLLYRSDRGGRNAIYAQPADGSGEARLLHGDDAAQIDEGVMSPDGRALLVQRDTRGDGELWLVPLTGSGEPRRLSPIDGLYGARFSPDGRWIAVAGGGTGGSQAVYVRRSDSDAGRVRISGDGGTTPVWSADGRHITYAQGRELLRVTVTSTDPFRVSQPRVVLSGPYVFNTVHADFDVAADGAILALRSPEQSARMVVVRNLAAELRQRFESAPR